MNSGFHKLPRRTFLSAALLSAMGASAAFPDKPIRLIVPFAAGGGTDTWARTYGARLATRLGQTVIVENKPGASTQLGANAVAKAEPDGYTLLFTTSTHIQLPALTLSLPYDVQRDFAPVGQLGVTGLMFVVNPQVKAGDMNEFIKEAKASNNWALGTYAAGSAGAVFSQLMVSEFGLNMPVAIYKGEAPAISDVVGGQIQGGFFSIPSVKSLVAAGKLKAIGNLSTSRTPSFPIVRTLTEQGLERYRWPGVWLGVFAPAQTPAAVLARITDASREIAKDRDFQTDWAERDVVVNWHPPADFQEEIRADMKTWSELIQKLGIKPE